MKILIVDDEPASRKLLRAQLTDEGHETREASDGVEALRILDEEGISAIVSDVLMPNMDGYVLCTEVRASQSFGRIPFIFCTSTYTDQSDQRLAMDLGADYFLHKPVPVGDILRAIDAIVHRHHPAPKPLSVAREKDVMLQYSHALVRKLEKRNDDLCERTAELFASEARLRSIFETEPDGVVVFGRDGILSEINPAGLEMFATTSLDGMKERHITQLIVVEHWEVFQEAMTDCWSGRKRSVEFQVAPAAEGGTRRWLEMHAAPLRNPEGVITALLGIIRDNTDRKALEAKYVQAQKMEVVGNLAGGIAHDFNNMLGIMMGYSDIALREISSGTPLYEHVETVFHTAERAAALTRQLLIFSRKQAVQPRILDLTEVLTGLDRMLRRVIGENVTMVTVPEMELRRVEADPGQIEQVLLNLTVNARDAMPKGGTVTLTTSNVAVTASHCPHPEMAPGDYAVLSVSDEGTGMTDEVKARIFEPFFTTKGEGQGTGLGLATCQSIVKRWRGYITVESVLGVGTTFCVYFPQAIHAWSAEPSAAEDGAPPRGDELVLVVEDEPGLRELAATILYKQGYEVLKAGDGDEAQRVLREPRARSIDLIVTDMVMPAMGGKVLAEQVRADHPGIRVLFTSGYTNCGLDGALEADIDFLPKPYTPCVLARRVRAALDRPCVPEILGRESLSTK